MKRKPIDVKRCANINFAVENNYKNPRHEVRDHARISKYKRQFAKGFTPNWSEEVLLLKMSKLL